jgi:hypothetical protein
VNRPLIKATKTGLTHLSAISNGWLTRSGRRSDYYHMQNGICPTRPMVDRLEELGWIVWTDNKAELTADGLVAMKGGAA